MKSFAGLGGYLASVQIDWAVAGMVTAAAVLGGLIGARLTARIDPEKLRQGFGWFVLIMAAVILGQEIHVGVGGAAAALTVAAAGVVYGRNRTTRQPRRRSPAASADGR
jgi:hypothetical protein